MTTPPRIDEKAVREAVDRIRARHDLHGDPHLELMGPEPEDVLFYLRRYAQSFRYGTRMDDLDDVALLLLWRLWEQKREQRFWLGQVVKLRGSRPRFAQVFGIGSRQGFTDWLDRLHALLGEGGPGRPDEKAGRADRKVGSAELANRPLEGPEQQWLAKHLGEYRKVADALVELYMDVQDTAAEAIAEVRRDLRDGPFTADCLTVLGLAVEEVARSRVEVIMRMPRDAAGEPAAMSAEQEKEYADRIEDAHRRIAAVVSAFSELQQRRRDAVLGL